MKRSIIIEKRKKARELKKKGWSNRKIARYLVANRESIRLWVAMGDEEIESDERGWQRGRLRRYTPQQRQQVIKIIRQLEGEGHAAIHFRLVKSKYGRQYGRELSDWFVRSVLREYRKKKKLLQGRQEGTATAGYPLRKLKRFGRVVMSIDVPGLRQVRSPQSSMTFLLCQYVFPHNLGIMSHIMALSADEVIRVLRHIWRIYLKPEMVKMGYNPAFGASLSRPGCVGKLTLFLLNLGIKPLYAPFPCTRGRSGLTDFTAVFTGDFCRQLCFPNRGTMDFRIENFYLEYIRKTRAGADRLKVPDPLYRDIFADVDVENRDVDRFLESNIFFYVRWK